jgi:hypothetical protein
MTSPNFSQVAIKSHQDGQEKPTGQAMGLVRKNQSPIRFAALICPGDYKTNLLPIYIVSSTQFPL